MAGTEPDPLAGAAAAWFRDRRRAGPPAEGRGWVRAEAGALAEGVLVRVWLTCQGGCVHGVRYQVFGGPGALACAGWMAEQLEGRPAIPGSVPPGREAVAALGLPTEAAGDALVVEDALRGALVRDPVGMKP